MIGVKGFYTYINSILTAIVFQAQCLRETITRLADGTKTFAQRISRISEAEKEIAGCIPVVPTHIGRNQQYQGRFQICLLMFMG